MAKLIALIDIDDTVGEPESRGFSSSYTSLQDSVESWKAQHGFGEHHLDIWDEEISQKVTSDAQRIREWAFQNYGYTLDDNEVLEITSERTRRFQNDLILYMDTVPGLEKLKTLFTQIISLTGNPNIHPEGQPSIAEKKLGHLISLGLFSPDQIMGGDTHSKGEWVNDLLHSEDKTELELLVIDDSPNAIKQIVKSIPINSPIRFALRVKSDSNLNLKPGLLDLNETGYYVGVFFSFGDPLMRLHALSDELLQNLFESPSEEEFTQIIDALGTFNIHSPSIFEFPEKPISIEVTMFLLYLSLGNIFPKHFSTNDSYLYRDLLRLYFVDRYLKYKKIG